MPLAANSSRILRAVAALQRFSVCSLGGTASVSMPRTFGQISGQRETQPACGRADGHLLSDICGMRFGEGNMALESLMLNPPRRSWVQRPQTAPSSRKFGRRSTRRIALTAIESPPFCEIASSLHRREEDACRRQPGPGARIYLVRRAPEPHHAHEHTPLYPSDECHLKEGRKSRGGRRASLHELQLLPHSPDVEGDACDGSRSYGSRLGGWGNCGSTGLILWPRPNNDPEAFARKFIVYFSRYLYPGFL